jgi:DnaJ-class molecular chaperone
MTDLDTTCERCGGSGIDPDWKPGDDPDDEPCFACDGLGIDDELEDDDDDT